MIQLPRVESITFDSRLLINQSLSLSLSRCLSIFVRIDARLPEIKKQHRDGKAVCFLKKKCTVKSAGAARRAAPPGTVFKMHRRSCSGTRHKSRWLFERPWPASINHRFLLTGSRGRERETPFHGLFARVIYSFVRARSLRHT